MHLTSKMRFISVQFEALLSNDLWFKNAKHANEMANFLYEQIKDIPEIKVTQKVEVNAIFSTLKNKLIKELQKKYGFHIFDEEKNEVRWMTSFNTTKKEILDFVKIINQII